MKEPLIVDFLERFLAEHNISQHPSVPSRPASVSSYRSGRSLTHPHHSKLSLSGLPSSISPIHSASRLSVRVSQAELLEYGHHSHSPTSLSTAGSPTTSVSLKNNNNYNSSPSIGPRSPHHLSRPTSMTSLDAAMTTMELNHADEPNGAGKPSNANKSTLSNGSKPVKNNDSTASPAANGDNLS